MHKKVDPPVAAPAAGNAAAPAAGGTAPKAEEGENDEKLKRMIN